MTAHDKRDDLPTEAAVNVGDLDSAILADILGEAVDGVAAGDPQMWFQSSWGQDEIGDVLAHI